MAESARNVVAAGGVPMALTNCLNFGSPERPDIFWQFKESVRGLADAARYLELPLSANLRLGKILGTSTYL